jgi:hypothetical protein
VLINDPFELYFCPTALLFLSSIELHYIVLIWQVLVWHTRTEKPKTKDEDKLIKKGIPSNPDIEV